MAARSMAVIQGGIRTVAHNVANVNTPGYSRQRQVLEAEHPEVRPDGTLGTGVRQTTVERITDDFIRRQLEQEFSAKGSLDTRAQAMARAEEVVNEQQGEGITAALSELYAAFQDLASSTEPGQPTERAALLSAAQALTARFHQADAHLRDQQRATDRSISTVVDEVNDLARRIADLNREIVRQEAISQANDLRDQRDELVRQLALNVEIDTFEKDDGAVVVSLRGGYSLVDGAITRDLVAVADPANPFDPTFSRVFFDDGATRFDVTGTLGGGRLGGLLEVRDQLLAGAIRDLDTIAYNLMRTVNDQHRLGFGLTGATGQDFFVNLAQVEDAARDLAVDPAVLADARLIAAAGAAPGAPGDNRNALALAALRENAQAIFLPGDPPGPATGPTRTVLSHAADLVAELGQQARSLESARLQQDRVLEVVQNQRDEISGVSVDEEVTALIQLQAAFQANARIIATMDRLLQDVVSML